MYVPFEWFRTSGRARSRFDLSTINRFYDLLDHDTIYGVEGAVSPPPPPRFQVYGRAGAPIFTTRFRLLAQEWLPLSC